MRCSLIRQRKQSDQYGQDFEDDAALRNMKNPRRRRTTAHLRSLEELYIELGWMLVNEHGCYIPIGIFQAMFAEELRAGIRLPFVYARTRHPATGATVIWLQKIKKESISQETLNH